MLSNIVDNIEQYGQQILKNVVLNSPEQVARFYAFSLSLVLGMDDIPAFR